MLGWHFESVFVKKKRSSLFEKVVFNRIWLDEK